MTTSLETYADAAEAQCPRCKAKPSAPCMEIACKHNYKNCQYAICAYWRELPEPHLERIIAARAFRAARTPEPTQTLDVHDEFRLEWSDGARGGSFGSYREAMHYASQCKIPGLHVAGVSRRTVTLTATEWKTVPK